MIKEKKLYRPVDYAKLIGLSPAAITKQMDKGYVKVVIKEGRRFIESDI